jgi:hypothetical protein
VCSGLKLKFIVLIVFSANIAHPDVACKSLQTLQRFAFVGGFFYRVYFADFQIFANLAKICRG